MQEQVCSSEEDHYGPVRSTAVDGGQMILGRHIRLYDSNQRQILWSVAPKNFWPWLIVVGWNLAGKVQFFLANLKPIRSKSIKWSFKKDCIFPSIKVIVRVFAHENIKVGYCASGPVGSFDLGCGIRLTLLGLKADSCFTIFLILPSISSQFRSCTGNRLSLLDYLVLSRPQLVSLISQQLLVI